MRRALLSLSVFVAAMAPASAQVAARPDWLLAQPAASPPMREAQAMAYDSRRNRVVMFGGANEYNVIDFADTWEWDGSTWIERATASGPSARFGHAMAYDAARGRVVMFGGYDFLSNAADADTWEWDGTAWVEASPATSPSGRYGHVMAYDSARGRIVLFGGTGIAGDFADTWEWDGSTWIDRTPGESPAPREYGAMTYDAARGRAVLFGGFDGSTYLGDTWEWDGSVWNERASAAQPPGRLWHMLTFDAARGRTVLFGGYDGNVPLGDTWEWDGDEWSASTPSTNPSPRVVAGMAFDPVRNRAMLFGGFNGYAPLGDTWEWDGTSWVERTPTTSPPPRSNHAAAYDENRGRTVIFGGYAGDAFLADTWEWDGTQWAGKRPAASPPSRIFHAMAYDGNRGKVVLFGGFGQRGPIADTWEWDGTNWVLKTPRTSPPPRHSHQMVYDAARGRIVLYGGADQNVLFDDTWEWDGTDWVEVTPQVSPPPRYHHAMAYDTVRQRVVLFGGCGNFACPADDTWEWDGTSWLERTPPTAPPPRADHALAFDAGRGRALLFGGSDGFQTFADTWEWDGNDWTEIVVGSAPPGRFHNTATWDGVSGRLMIFGGFDGVYFADTWEYGAIGACGDANREVDFVPGGGGETTAAAALGAQDGATVELGVGGRVELGLDRAVRNGAGTDLVVHALAGGSYRVEAGDDSSTYVVVRDCPGGECQLDLQEAGLATASRLRITALSEDLGVALDAVSLIHADVCGNRLPLADAGPDRVYECEGSGQATARLDGSTSSDPDSTWGTSDDVVTYAWTEGPRSLAMGVAASVPLALGVHDVTLRVTDRSGATASDESRVTVQDTTPPTLTCPASVAVECRIPGGAIVIVPPAVAADTCFAAASIANDRSAGGADASGAYPLGTTTVTFTATDGAGNVATCRTSITVADTTAPEVTVRATPDLLWPPDHKLHSVHLTVVAVDACDPSPTLLLDSVVCSEPIDPQDVQGAAFGSADFDVLLRAERNPRGPGRAYSLRYRSIDASHNPGIGVGVVRVPHAKNGPPPRRGNPS